MSSFAPLQASGPFAASSPVLSAAAHIIRGIALRLQSSRSEFGLEEAPDDLLRDIGFVEGPAKRVTELWRNRSGDLFDGARFD